MKILVLRFSSIGDIVLTTPVVRCLKRQLPGATVHYASRKSYASLLKHNPYIDKLHLLGEDLTAFISELKEEQFDYIVDLHHNVRTWKIKRALKCRAFSFPKLNVEKWLLTALKINRLPSVHIVDRYFKAAEPLGVQNDGGGLDYFISEEERVKESDIPLSHQAGYIGIAIGAALNTKKLPVEKLQAICRQIDHPIILMGGPEDAANAELIATVDPVKVYNACGKFSMNESADLVRRSKVMITHDTGLMHIAAAFQKPVVSIWGNTVPAFGMYPYYGAGYTYPIKENDSSARRRLPFTVVEVEGLGCRPCSKIGYKKCPRGHFKCMQLQSEEEICAAVYRIIGGSEE
ncbi:MAG TPA: glycosyltransferase family 9 protein [Chitinophagaceae bacterium]|nr:glycosyltransferase family 9 protein [Chitinophagaceae bacterium]